MLRIDSRQTLTKYLRTFLHENTVLTIGLTDQSDYSLYLIIGETFYPCSTHKVRQFLQILNLNGSLSIYTERFGILLQKAELNFACTGGANTLYFTDGYILYTWCDFCVLGNHSFNRYIIFILGK